MPSAVPTNQFTRMTNVVYMALTSIEHLSASGVFEPLNERGENILDYLRRRMKREVS